MTYTMFYRAIPGGIATAVLTLSLLLGLPGNGIAADQPAEELTYAKHVAPIFQEKCQDCHQPNSIAPMSLLTYEEVKSYAPMIRAKVAARVMPP